MTNKMLSRVHETNRDRRTMDLMARRFLKLGEEYGEANQAYLSVTSEHNGKDKTWADVREELTDCLVITLDLLLHRFPDEETDDLEIKSEVIMTEMERKLKKWVKKQKRGHDTSE